MAKLPKTLKQNISLLDVHSHVGIDPLLYFTHSFPYCHSLRDSFEECERVRISHAVIFPWGTSFYYHLPSLLNGKVRFGGKMGKAPFHFENEHMLRQLYEVFPDYRKKFIPFAIMDTLRETRSQVRILDQLIGKYPFYGLKVHPRATQARLSTLADQGKPLLEFAKTYDLPILIHTAVTSLDPLSQISDLLDIARKYPSLRFCAAHFCSFHQKVFEEVDRMKNVWADSAAMSIGCDLVLQKSNVYESGKAKIPSDYRDPSQVFADLAERFPETFMWGTDNPAHTWISSTRFSSSKIVHLKLWSSMERERNLLKRVKGNLFKKIAFENALRFIEG